MHEPASSGEPESATSPRLEQKELFYNNSINYCVHISIGVNEELSIQRQPPKVDRGCPGALR